MERKHLHQYTQQYKHIHKSLRTEEERKRWRERKESEVMNWNRGRKGKTERWGASFLPSFLHTLCGSQFLKCFVAVWLRDTLTRPACTGTVPSGSEEIQICNERKYWESEREIDPIEREMDNRKKEREREVGGTGGSLGSKFISTKVVQCCGEKDSPLYCCYIAPPAPWNQR